MEFFLNKKIKFYKNKNYFFDEFCFILKKMNILIIGNNKKRDIIYNSIKKDYTNLKYLDTNKIFFKKNKYLNYIFYLFPFFFEKYLNNFFNKYIKNNYDIILIISVDYISKKALIKIKSKSKKVIAYVPDNPFVNRDKNRFFFFNKSINFYDKIIFIQKSRINLANKKKLKNIQLIWPCFSNKIHKKNKIIKNELKLLNNDVVFIGTHFHERSIFFEKLIRLGLDLKIYGTRWDEAKNFKFLKKNIQLGHVDGTNYSKIIQCSKIALCLPSQENLDDITIRNVEIPAIGSLLCSKRTNEAKKLLKEDHEAIYFNNAYECYTKCKYYLENPNKLNKIASNGNRKIKSLKIDYRTTFKKIFKNIK